MHACVCACLRACVPACVRACVSVSVHACVCAYVRAHARYIVIIDVYRLITCNHTLDDANVQCIVSGSINLIDIISSQKQAHCLRAF